MSAIQNQKDSRLLQKVEGSGLVLRSNSVLDNLDKMYSCLKDCVYWTPKGGQHLKISFYIAGILCRILWRHKVVH